MKTKTRHWWLSSTRWHRFFLTIQVATSGLTIWWLLRTLPHPGYASLVASLVAALMSVHEKMRSWSKALWLVLLGGLLFVEMRAIKSDRQSTEAQALRDRQKQDESFRTLREQQNKKFAETLQKMQANTQDTLDALTGGTSYGRIFPTLVSASPLKAKYYLSIWVEGKNVLWGTHVDMKEGPIDVSYEASHIDKLLSGKLRKSVMLGSVSKTYSTPIGWAITPSSGKINTYYFWVWSLAKLTTEQMDIRYNGTKKRWEEAWQVHREGVLLEKLDFGDARVTTYSK